MLSLTRVSSGQASTYYQVDDYYLQEYGEWQGKLADELGLSGEIKEDDFKKLIEGIDPGGKFEIQSGGKDNIHSAGVDLTFSAPKSVSIAGLVLDDQRVFDAHSDAVEKTLAYIEQNYTNVRIHDKDKVYNQETGNLLAAKFQHVSSRELDPQLHTHCLVMNITKKDDGTFKAMDYKDIYDNKMLLGQVYRNELAANLKDLGYTIEVDKNGLFEIAGVSKELMKEFSTRSEQIKERLEQLKQEYPTLSESKLKELATLDSRQTKKEVGLEDLKVSWDKKVAELGIDKNTVISDMKSMESSQSNIDDIVKHAIKIATETEAVVKEEEILRIAAKLGTGQHRLEELESAIQNNKDLIKYSDGMYTTKEIMTKEHGIVDKVIEGKGQVKEITTTNEVQKEIYKYQLDHGFKLTDGQKKAVEHVMTTNDRIIAIQGDAGTGKTTMLDVVRTIADKEKMEVVGMSFTGKAASEIQEASGIQSGTLASFIHSQDTISNKLVVIDEASMISIKDMDSVLRRCDDSTRIVLIGDTKQLQSIGAGKVFSSLQEKEVISTVRMSEVQRQTDKDYKEVVDKISAKKIEVAIEKLESKDKLYEISDRAMRLESIKDEYLKNAKSTIIVTASNRDREELNKMIRSELVNNGKVNNDGLTYSTREVKSLVQDEKHYAQSYSPGDIIVANNKGVLGKSGEAGTVISVNQQNQTIQIQTQDTKMHTIDVKTHGQDLQVYTKEQKEFAVGDKVLFLKNDKGIDVKNGNTGYVQDINAEGRMQVKLDTGKDVTLNLNKQYNYVSHGYAITDFKSQGQTAKNVIYNADSQRGINYNQAYVGITRGKEDVKVFTDDKNKFKQGLSKAQEKTSTLDQNINKGIERERLTTKTIDTQNSQKDFEKSAEIKPRMLEREFRR